MTRVKINFVYLLHPIILKQNQIKSLEQIMKQEVAYFLCILYPNLLFAPEEEFFEKLQQDLKYM